MQQNEIMRDDRGVDRCHRIIKGAVLNVPGDETKGYRQADVYCNQPVTLNISEGRKFCPKCEKPAPIGNVNPRVTNSAGVVLTQKEIEECGVKEDTSLKTVQPKPIKKEKKPKEAVEAKVVKAKKDEIAITVPLSALEGGEDIAAILIKKASEALDSLPTPTFAESKRLIRLQEKLENLLRV